MQTSGAKTAAILFLMMGLGAWSLHACAAQTNIYAGKVISRSATTITLDLNPCGAERKQTISPYTAVGTPRPAKCPDGKEYMKASVAESNAPVVDPVADRAGEFSGKMISESNDAITIDLNPCGTKTSKTISPFEKKGSAVDQLCPNGDKYSRITVVGPKSGDKDKEEDKDKGKEKIRN